MWNIRSVCYLHNLGIDGGVWNTGRRSILAIHKLCWYDVFCLVYIIRIRDSSEQKIEQGAKRHLFVCHDVQMLHKSISGVEICKFIIGLEAHKYPLSHFC